MITHEAAVAGIGALVVYRAPHVPMTEAGEEGVITSVGARVAFVRYGSDTGSKATDLSQLTWTNPAHAEVEAAVDRPDSPSHYRCDKTPGGRETHHMGEIGSVPRCRYCGRSRAEIMLQATR